ncbi:MAG: flippase-like domain-containing protein [Gemmatimonadaceae bacterium]|nr:flippase-like domain-containing protein [Gemmatimonadaceae bacterium]
MRDRVWRVAQFAVVALLLWFVAQVLRRQWGELAPMLQAVTVDRASLALSGLLVLASYLVLIETWRDTVSRWGAQLSFGDAMRIWFVSNLGRYLPGKVWQIGAMGALAQRVGVPATAAVGSSIVIALVNIVVGVAVTVAASPQMLALDTLGWSVIGMLTAGVIALPWLLPVGIGVVRRLTGREVALPALPPQVIWRTAAGCALAWLLYGAAFRALAVAVLPAVGGTARDATAVFTGSYLAGFLALFAPGGVGVREVAMYAALERTGMATGASATLLVAASRAWLTLAELLPGLLFLGWARRQTRTASPSSIVS